MYWFTTVHWGVLGGGTVGGVTTAWCVGTDNSCSVSGDVAMATLIAHSISVPAPIRTD